MFACSATRSVDDDTGDGLALQPELLNRGQEFLGGLFGVDSTESVDEEVVEGLSSTLIRVFAPCLFFMWLFAKLETLK